MTQNSVERIFIAYPHSFINATRDGDMKIENSVRPYVRLFVCLSVCPWRWHSGIVSKRLIVSSKFV